ncbi:zinc finger protein ubi-d4 A-like isoform X2 [Bacillus rossius redtenbacheri]|uniref:zinc finger protein ubi-d4 A-like isoform X2 n=1 Tax=Bacillus rossius redtenbacheri TaxID=93214 RepID=UPI002FDEB54A
MACGIEIGNLSVLRKIESFLNDSAYKEAIENSANYNTRLCIERRLRMPFLDSQTGVAQNHSNLFMTPRERIPGVNEGQIYTYPSKCWRKKRRQYLSNFLQPHHHIKELEVEAEAVVASVVETPAAAASEDSKESITVKEEVVKKSSDTVHKVSLQSTLQDAWYYDELDMHEMEAFDEPDPDSDLDYEETYSKRKGKKRSTKSAKSSDSPASKKSKGTGRGRKKANYDPVADAEKPFACELCGARYKTRPGLTYHYTHSHKERDDDESLSSEGVVGATERGSASPGAGQQPPGSVAEAASPAGSSTRRGRQGSAASQPTPASVSSASSSPAVSSHPADEVGPGEKAVAVDRKQPEMLLSDDKERATPSPYCDFCLGDATENKKTGHSEQLVSCSDCGRSGHPTCLQFTQNMIISVHKYRWQCIECKCCSICGTSDNDDQLLFCDDCDRGYHMYCLAPPLSTPPEGSWSCCLCLIEFHKK